MVDVVLLGLTIPCMSRTETIDVIKERHPLVRTIKPTGRTTASTAVDGIKQGA